MDAAPNLFLVDGMSLLDTLSDLLEHDGDGRRMDWERENGK